MKGFIFITILFAVISIQVSAKPVEDSFSSELLDWAISELNADESATAAEKLLAFTVENISKKPKEYVAKAINVTESLLADPALGANNKPIVVEFKKNLTELNKNYEGELSLREAMDSFANLTEYYYKLPEEKVTEDFKFIIDILNKYDCKNVAMKLDTHLELFFPEFIKKFEESRNGMEKPILDWFDKFITLNDLQKKIESIAEFIDLV